MKIIREFLENIFGVIFISFLYLMISPLLGLMLIHRLLIHLFGVNGEAEVIEYSRPYDHEDECAEAVYVFSDKRGRSHRGRDKCCIHWPSDQQWDCVEKGYSVGAKNPIRYIPLFPKIHKVYFPEPPEGTIHTWGGSPHG